MTRASSPPANDPHRVTRILCGGKGFSVGYLFNLRTVHPEGRIVVSNQTIHPRHRSAEGHFGHADLAPLIGARIKILQSGIERILRIDDTSVKKLIAAGVIHSPDAEGFYLFDPGWTLADLFDRWMARFPTPKTHEDFDRLKVAWRLCHVPDEYGVRQDIIDAVKEKMGELGSTNNNELKAFVVLRKKGTVVRDAIQNALKGCRTGRARAAEPPTWSEVERTYPALRGLPGTYLEKGLTEVEEPNPGCLARVWQLRTWRGIALIALLLRSAEDVPTCDLTEMIHTFETAERLAQAADPEMTSPTPEAVKLVLSHFSQGFDAQAKYEAGSQSPTWNYIKIVRFAHTVVKVQRFISRSTNDRLLDFAPPDPPDRPFWQSRIREMGKKQCEIASANRQSRVRHLNNNRLLLLEKAEFRAEAIKHAALQARIAVGNMGDRAYKAFSVQEFVFGQNGELLDGAQVSDWIAWRVPPYTDTLPPIPTFEPTEIGPEAETEEAALGPLDDIVFEYVGSRPTAGAVSIEPFYVTISEHGTLCCPASLPVGMRGHRHKLLVDWNLPDFPSTPKGLLRFGRDRVKLFRETAKQRRSIVPLLQFELAMRFAHLGLLFVQDSACRSGEFRQASHSESAMPKDEKSGRASFKAIPKITLATERVKAKNFPISAQTRDDAFELAEMIIDHCHQERGCLPDIRHTDALGRKCGISPYIFSWMGKPLNLYHLHVFLRYLLANSEADFCFHDFRYTEANSDKLSGMSLQKRMERLRHRSPGSTRKYDQLTPEQVVFEAKRENARRAANLITYSPRRNRHVADKAS